MAKILLVDDDELVRYALTRVLTSAGHQVDVAENGLKAIRQFKLSPPDLVLTDIVMPDQDGLELLREIGELNAQMPVVVMTGGGEIMGQDYLLFADRLGASAIILKPFENAVLLSKIDGLLKNPPSAH